MTFDQTLEGECPDDRPETCKFTLDGVEYDANYYGSIESVVPPLPIYIIKTAPEII